MTFRPCAVRPDEAYVAEHGQEGLRRDRAEKPMHRRARFDVGTYVCALQDGNVREGGVTTVSRGSEPQQATDPLLKRLLALPQVRYPASCVCAPSMYADVERL